MITVLLLGYHTRSTKAAGGQGHQQKVFLDSVHGMRSTARSMSVAVAKRLVNMLAKASLPVLSKHEQT
ncbi:hypothetical protein COCSUDRAFT_34350 [Coccomyxa subellipsoidea C-169]|uniref:Uncharacterized protein n=1 Tax=Coccomyxa subellipsoidea (strain C-169) TaxID=574566 RepID=I0YL14_COCSC|nr:hypothetical protein COCSUDRAFT_34350 [Coccomyxa subellipsoidea C-169]EIE19083.1 hypothetical protein COCSUDRAFT_34350 [Coccomyxa subellipsoidea C-169]|eukprot:XP_005643627.1 hypothetical protein COCSUDRAFT_34350 [Coccomyxa subellipsoidea C-169]